MNAAKLSPNDVGIRTELKAIQAALKVVENKSKEELKANLQKI